MDNLTHEQWSQLPAQKRAEYNANNIDTKKFEFDTEGILINLERIRGDISTVWERAYSFYEFENIFYRLKPEPPIPQYRPFESVAEFAPNRNKLIIDKAGNIATFQAIDSDCRVKYACHGKKTFQEAFRDFEFIYLTTGERSPFGVEI